MSGNATVHASAVLLGEDGILIRGASGSGKSSLALALLALDRKAAWLVADDQVVLEARNGRLLASVPAEIAGLIEIRGQGLMRRPHISPVVIRLVVDLMPADACPRLPSLEEERAEVEGIGLPRLILPIGSPDGALRVAAILDRLVKSEIALRQVSV